LTDGLWACLTCGFIGCGGDYPLQGHNNDHFVETEHIYSKKIILLGQNGQIFDHAKKDFVHRLLYDPDQQNLVSQDDQKGFKGDQDPFEDLGKEKGDLKRQELMNNYEEIIAAQLESQRNYYQGLIKETQKDILDMNVDKGKISSDMKAELVTLEALKAKNIEVVMASKERLLEIKKKFDGLMMAKEMLVEANGKLLISRAGLEGDKQKLIEAKREELRKIKEQNRDVIQEIADLNGHLKAKKTVEANQGTGGSAFIMNTGGKGKGNQKK
jgi:BRCA1-associated protein